MKRALINFITSSNWLAPLRNFIRKHPRFKETLLFIIGFTRANDFRVINIDGVQINFHLPATYGPSGIGRVSRMKLQGLIALSDNQPVKKEIYFYPSLFSCPKELKQPAALMVHDLIPLLVPEIYDNAMLVNFETKYKDLARQARHIVTISETSKNDIMEHYNIIKNKISIVYNGVASLESQENKPPPPATRPYFITLGGVDKKKNIKMLVELWRDDAEVAANYDLKIIGDNKTFTDTPPAGVIFLGQLSDNEVAEIAKGSQALLFPSLREGFGLPPFEVALLGVPSICAARPTMTEFLEGAALFVEPDDKAGWKVAMQQIVQDRELAKQLADETKSRILNNYTPEHYIKNILSVLKDVAEPITN